MGSERKTKERHRKRITSSSDSEDEGRRRRKRHKSVEGEDEERKSNKKSSHKHSSKHRSHKDKENKSRDKDKVKHQKGDPEPTYEFKEISKDDYFAKNNEFSTWLKEKKKVFFSDLSAESSREMFTDFVKAWNRQKLESRYYEGAIVSAPRSAHKWKIRS